MPGSAEFIQRAVHALEAGALAVWVRRSLVALAVIALAIYYFYDFRGLATSQAMDQAQIGRALASGHGWQTNFVRPRAIGQLQAHGKNVAQKIWSDTYNAPLPPLIDAIALWPVKSHSQMSMRDLVYAGDKAIAAMSIFLFLLSVLVLFLTARRLFDRRLALLACGLVVLCDMLWQYSLSGLPQMLLLLLFNATIYALVRAVEAQYNGGRVGAWLAAVGIGFGLLALTHALTIWIFAGALVFCVFFFRPRGRVAVILLATFTIIYTPWLIRNYIACGNPGGVAIYSVLDGIRHSEAGWMRRINLDVEGIGPANFRDKVTTNFFSQWGHIFEYFGSSVVAMMFFVALLHPFKRTETAVLRWMILAMWIGAVAGMAIFGINEEEGLAANQLHLIFVPLMTCYGLAYLLVQWYRLGIQLSIARIAFLSLLYFLCALPAIFTVPWLARANSPIRWPPYAPPYIATLHNWMQPNEITASDMPWAIAWYADRRALWLPETPKTLIDLSDYNLLGGPVNGLYLTPISGSQDKLADILRGEYKDWAPFILRNMNLEKFSLKWGTLLGVEDECIFLSDHDREHARAP
ncbi:MAG: glycosyltransferase family 39 protein [Chthoniobacterales bacterium]